MAKTLHFMAGGGGDVSGFEAAGHDPVWAGNHLDGAIATIELNRPHITTQVGDVAELDMRALPSVQIGVGSPICTEAAPAGGNSTRSQDDEPWEETRITAQALVDYARIHRPEIVTGENVLGFARWKGIDQWIDDFAQLGYEPHFVALNAMHVAPFGQRPVAQSRERMLFFFAQPGIKFDLDIWPEARCQLHGKVLGTRQWKPSKKRIMVAGWPIGEYDHGGRGAYCYVCPHPGCGRRVEPVVQSAAPHIDWTLPMRYVWQGRYKNTFTAYADETKRKIAIGLEKFDGKPFVVICRKNKTVESLDGPLATVTAAGNHHMLIAPGPDATVDGCRLRMLGTAEKAALQGFSPDWKFWDKVSPADKAKKVRDMGGTLAGNAVPVPVGQWAGKRAAWALAA
ncbi:DNA cytosine methyltransferase [Actinomadura atramentaria]|uniref:DNA cytosine methyltransferase n=1 Tax=Actinomadura atramentaria TaxID=1990 RepID=UPI00039C8941|nr:DNA cytosine methyltransferase [Actinomadura atramentaria]